MIDLEAVKLGDCCYILVSFQAKPLFGEVVKILEKEEALEVTTSFGTRVSTIQNTYWAEKEAKKNKFVKLDNNYKQWIKEMLHEKAETDDRID